MAGSPTSFEAIDKKYQNKNGGTNSFAEETVPDLFSGDMM